jgi:hypothetical protein
MCQNEAMKITEEWRMFDPKDIRTHPEGPAPRVEVEFADGRKMEGIYSGSTGWFGTVGTLPQNTEVLRWRYTSETPENS